MNMNNPSRRSPSRLTVTTTEVVEMWIRETQPSQVRYRPHTLETVLEMRTKLVGLVLLVNDRLLESRVNTVSVGWILDSVYGQLADVIDREFHSSADSSVGEFACDHWRHLAVDLLYAALLICVDSTNTMSFCDRVPEVDSTCLLRAEKRRRLQWRSFGSRRLNGHGAASI
jgi:hypothetical protein